MEPPPQLMHVKCGVIACADKYCPMHCTPFPELLEEWTCQFDILPQQFQTSTYLLMRSLLNVSLKDRAVAILWYVHV